MVLESLISAIELIHVVWLLAALVVVTLAMWAVSVRRIRRARFVPLPPLRPATAVPPRAALPPRPAPPEPSQPERPRAESPPEARRRTLHTLPRALRELSAASSSEQLMVALGRVVGRTLAPAQWMTFADVKREGAEYTLVAVDGDNGHAWPVGAVLSPHMGRVGLVVERKVAMDRKDFDAEPPIVRERLAETEPDGFSVDLAAPVLSGGEVLGIVTAGIPGVPLDVARPMLEALAEHATLVQTLLDARERAQWLENRDELTSLGNRNWFTAHGAELLFSNRDTGLPIALALVGVDHLREYAAREGAGQAGRLLQGIAECVSPLFRDGDLVARWSDDEFAFLMPGLDLKLARDVAEKVRRTITSEAWQGAGEQPGAAVTVSVGIAVMPDNGLQFEELVESAYASLARAREQGGDRTCGEYPGVLEAAYPGADPELRHEAPPAEPAEPPSPPSPAASPRTQPLREPSREPPPPPEPLPATGLDAEGYGEFEDVTVGSPDITDDLTITDRTE